MYAYSSVLTYLLTYLLTFLFTYLNLLCIIYYYIVIFSTFVVPNAYKTYL